MLCADPLKWFLGRRRPGRRTVYPQVKRHFWAVMRAVQIAARVRPCGYRDRLDRVVTDRIRPGSTIIRSRFSTPSISNPTDEP
jgi:hypothetical protein